MPNYTTNILRVHGELKEIDRLREFVEGRYQAFDFDKIIPMPKELDIEEIDPADAELMQKRAYNLEKYGFSSWYDWRKKHWGTKWNCRECDEKWLMKFGDACIKFKTAWCPPIPIINKLRELFPNLQIFCRYNNEDWLDDIWDSI